jgi:hypothetical protein
MSSSKDRRSSKIERGDVRLAQLAAPAREVTIGVIASADASGPCVDWPGNPAGAPVRALSTAALGRGAVGREAALLFADGDPASPVVIGLVQKAPVDRARLPDARLDGERIVLEAAREIELRCGRASITLTRAGKILIRGAYVSSRASGMQRIKGASVQIN